MPRDEVRKARVCKERYEWYKERGICTTCGVMWAEPGHVRCKACEAKIARYHDKSHEQRLERARQRRQERIDKGLCTECGIRPATEGMRMCPRCRAMRNDSTRKYKIGKKIEREIKKARQQGVNNGG